MLMLVNPMNCVFEHIRDDTVYGSRLSEKWNYYVLDTDDLCVERISYGDLLTVMRDDDVYLWNVAENSRGIYIYNSLYSCWQFSGVVDLLRGLAHYYVRTQTLQVGGKVHEFRILTGEIYNSGVLEYKLYLNDMLIYTWGGRMSAWRVLQLLYMFKLGGYYILRFRVELGNSNLTRTNTEYVNITVLLNESYDFAGVVFEAEYEKAKLICDSVFLSKLSVIVGQRY